MLSVDEVKKLDWMQASAMILRLQAELEKAQQCLPNTYYAGLSFIERLRMLVKQWNRAVTVNQELEQRLEQAQRERDEALDRISQLEGGEPAARLDEIRDMVILLSDPQFTVQERKQYIKSRLDTLRANLAALEDKNDSNN